MSQYPPAQQPGVAYAPAPQAPQAQPQVVTVVVPAMNFGEQPVQLSCPYCQSQIVTSTNYINGMMTWLAAAGICGIGCIFFGITWLGCCLIPFCVNGMKDVEHACPSCNRPVGSYKRMG